MNFKLQNSASMLKEYSSFERGVIASIAWQIKGMRDGIVPEDATRRILRASLRRIRPLFRGRSVRVTEDSRTHIDHVIPVSVVATLLLSSTDISNSQITTLLDRYLRSAEITEEEHKVVLRPFNSIMPPRWNPACTDIDNDLARYKEVGIVLVQSPPPSTIIVTKRSGESVSRERFPMLRFYDYANNHDLESDVVRIQELAETLPPTVRERKTTFKRGLAVELLEEENLLDSFLNECWPYGLTAAGRSEIRQCKNFTQRWQRMESHSFDRLAAEGDDCDLSE